MAVYGLICITMADRSAVQLKGRQTLHTDMGLLVIGTTVYDDIIDPCKYGIDRAAPLGKLASEMLSDVNMDPGIGSTSLTTGRNQLQIGQDGDFDPWSRSS